jgi:tRNA G18 (ribose-2'-O)-methylase SpoU
VPVVAVSSASDPRLDVFRNQKDAWLRAPHNPQRAEAAPQPEPLFMAEGELVVRQLFASPLRVHAVLASPVQLERMGPELAGLPEAVPVYVAERGVLAEVVGFDLHRGILAAGHRPPPADWREVARRARTLVVLEDLANHDNVGSVFRSVAALAGHQHAAVLLTPRCCDPLYRKALRVSMGWALRVPHATIAPWPEAIDAVRALGFATYALTPEPAAADVASIDAPGRACLLLGAEGPGLSAAALSGADVRVRISIDPAVDSLNAGVAAAIALHRLARP